MNENKKLTCHFYRGLAASQSFTSPKDARLTTYKTANMPVLSFLRERVKVWALQSPSIRSCRVWS